MFHLFKTAYLEFDYLFDGLGYKFIMGSPMVGDGIGLPMGGPQANDILYPVTNSFEELIKIYFDNKIEKFWEKLYNFDNKIICYLRPDDVIKLQIQYWKSIFRFANVNDIYLLHKSWIESVRLRSFISTTAHDHRQFYTRQWIKILTFDDFKKLYDETEICNFLKNDIQLEKLSFEYLLADFLYNGSSSKMKEEMLNRVKLITLDNWRDEIEQLKLETIFGFLDINQVDSQIKPEIGTIENQLKNSKTLKWMVDDNFDSDPSYIKSHYNYLDFVEQWRRIYEIWGGTEDMREINDLIIEEKWETLLYRDIDRNFGCLFTFELFKDKSNQIFGTYLYQKKRENKTDDLYPYKLD